MVSGGLVLLGDLAAAARAVRECRVLDMSTMACGITLAILSPGISCRHIITPAAAYFGARYGQQAESTEAEEEAKAETETERRRIRTLHRLQRSAIRARRIRRIRHVRTVLHRRGCYLWSAWLERIMKLKFYDPPAILLAIAAVLYLLGIL
jgi:hypothetical protein